MSVDTNLLFWYFSNLGIGFFRKRIILARRLSSTSDSEETKTRQQKNMVKRKTNNWVLFKVMCVLSVLPRQVLGVAPGVVGVGPPPASPSISTSTIDPPLIQREDLNEKQRTVELTPGADFVVSPLPSRPRVHPLSVDEQTTDEGRGPAPIHVLPSSDTQGGLVSTSSAQYRQTTPEQVVARPASVIQAKQQTTSSRGGPRPPLKSSRPSAAALLELRNTTTYDWILSPKVKKITPPAGTSDSDVGKPLTGHKHDTLVMSPISASADSKTWTVEFEKDYDIDKVEISVPQATGTSMNGLAISANGQKCVNKGFLWDSQVELRMFFVNPTVEAPARNHKESRTKKRDDQTAICVGALLIMLEHSSSVLFFGPQSHTVLSWDHSV